MSSQPLVSVGEPNGLSDLLTTLGMLLYRWSVLESTLWDEVRRFRMAGGDSESSLQRVRGSAGERLGEWRALISQKTRRDAEMAKAVSTLSTRIERHRRDRNLIARDFEGVVQLERELAIACGGPLSGHSTSTMRKFTLPELRDLVQEIDACAECLLALGEKIRQRK